MLKIILKIILIAYYEKKLLYLVDLESSILTSINENKHLKKHLLKKFLYFQDEISKTNRKISRLYS